MKENKQITIYELLPLLKPGWICMNKTGYWVWFCQKPHLESEYGMWCRESVLDDQDYIICIDIAPFDGDWKDSLMEVKG